MIIISHSLILILMISYNLYYHYLLTIYYSAYYIVTINYYYVMFNKMNMVDLIKD